MCFFQKASLRGGKLRVSSVLRGTTRLVDTRSSKLPVNQRFRGLPVATITITLIEGRHTEVTTVWE